MTNKLFGTKQITHLIYGLVMLLPFLSILGRTMYTIVNKNAKDSYSDKQLISTTKVDNETLLIVGKEYHLEYYYNTANQSSPKFFYRDINIEWSDYGFDPNFEYNAFQVTGYLYGNNLRINIYDTNGNVYYSNSIWGTTLTEIIFTLESVENPSRYNINCLLYLFNYETQSLDNAFEYSLSQFTEDNNIGSVDFFSWFTDLFLDQDNSHNAIYLNFVNWYMNYALLTSSGYLLFLCLLWFVNYVRRILDKSMNHDMGGF